MLLPSFGDSTALLHVLSRLAQRFQIELFAHGVDHGLRPEASAELDLAERLARDLGVPFSRTRVSVASGSNLQGRARAARYAALDAEANRLDARWVATAHHASDRAETVLMHVLRGTRAAPLLPGTIAAHARYTKKARDAPSHCRIRLSGSSERRCRGRAAHPVRSVWIEMRNQSRDRLTTNRVTLSQYRVGLTTWRSLWSAPGMATKCFLDEGAPS